MLATLLADNGHDELTDKHSNRTEQEQRSTSPFLDQVQTREGGHHVHHVRDERDGKFVFDFRAFEERGAVIEDEIDTAQLLQGL